MPRIDWLDALAILLALVVVVLLSRRPRAARRGELRLLAQSAWDLEHLCRTTDTLLRAGATPEFVVFDLRHVERIELETVAALEFACARWREAGAQVRIRHCHAAVEAVLRCSEVCRPALSSTTTTGSVSHLLH